MPRGTRLKNSHLQHNDCISNDLTDPHSSFNTECPKGSRKDLWINPIGLKQKRENYFSNTNVNVRQDDIIIPFSSRWYQ